MKRLRNIAIYYIILGGLLFASLYLALLWVFSLVGVGLFIIYILLKFIFRVKTIPQVGFLKNNEKAWDVFFYLHPLLLVLLIYGYTQRPFKQNIILPKNYEGVVTVDYNILNGQKEKWTGSFLGIGGRRVIKVDTNGYAKTKFKFIDNSIPILDIDSGTPDVEDIKIYYETDLKKKIPQYQGNDELHTDDKYDKYVANNSIVAYYVYATEWRTMYVVCKGSNYYNYFYTESEKEELNKNGGCHYFHKGRSELREHYFN